MICEEETGTSSTDVTITFPCTTLDVVTDVACVDGLVTPTTTPITYWECVEE